MQESGCSPRVDALDKACGRERYAVDETPPGCLWAGVRRAGIPHGLIASLDVASARAVPGVVAVCTRDDVRQGIVHKDQPVLCGERVRHCGAPVALVVAETREALATGLARIRAAYTPLPGGFDPEGALLADALLVHPGREGGNLLAQGKIGRPEGEDGAQQMALAGQDDAQAGVGLEKPDEAEDEFLDSQLEPVAFPPVKARALGQGLGRARHWAGKRGVRRNLHGNGQIVGHAALSEQCLANASPCL